MTQSSSMSSSAKRRVVITGTGWVTPLGCDVDSVWSKLLAGASGAGPVTRFDASTLATNFAAEVKEFALAQFLDDPASLKRHAHAGLGTQFALAAAAQAWKQAKLGGVPGLGGPERGPRGEIGTAPDGEGGIMPHRFGMYLGAGEGSLDYENFVAANLAGWNTDERALDGPGFAKVGLSQMTVEREVGQEPNAPLMHLAGEFGMRGPSLNCMTACAAGTQCVGEAFEIIRRGDADAMLAGGSHSMIHPLGMTGFVRLTAMSTRRDDPKTASRPFDRTREGFVMGEGAGVVILESLENALARGATPIAEVIGYGASADAYRITDIKPDGSGAQLAIRRALAQAGIEPTAPDGQGGPPVQYISAHGTGTPENDGIETRAVKAVFGDQAPRVPFSSVKSMLGHLIQAAGVVELITCVKAIETGFVPPTINLHNPDPKCDLDYVPNEARDMRSAGGVDIAISNGFGFGGQNNSIVIRRPQ